MSKLKLSFLGPPQVEQNDSPIDIGASKAMALLTYLAVTGQSHSRDALSTLLWSESDQRRARTYLRHALWTLKKELDEKWLPSSRTQIGFRADEDVWLDVAVFQEKITAVAGHDHPVGQMCAACWEALQEAVSLYRDHFLAGFTLTDSPAFDEWQFFQAEELRQMLTQALERLVQEYTAQQAYEPALPYARRWLALDQLHEPVHRSLMRLYARAGQQAAALRQYHLCQQLLSEELGVEPEAETTALYERIRTRQLEPSPEIDVEIASPSQELSPDRYLIEEFLVAGAHGQVYRGRDTQTGEPVIIKRLRPDVIHTKKGVVARFIQEAEALGQLNHPNIVRLLATFEQGGQQHLVMEYVTGGSLAQRMQQQPQMPLNEGLDIALELADALSRAHHVHIIHRDVKPENVLLAADGTPRLSDFGLARLLKNEGRLTDAGTLLGSPAYMSPEMLQGAEPDARSDIWSFGVLLFEMLAGQRPFPGEQVTAVMISILNDPTPDICQLRPELPPALSDLLRRMLAKNPADRMVSMRLVAAELEAIRAGQDGLATAVNDTVSEPDIKAISPPQSDQTSLFVAREAELNRLDEKLRAACSGRPQVLFILGEAGQGKTALLQAFARQAQETVSSLITAGGNCNAYTGKGDPYLPFREILALLTADPEGSSLTNPLQPELTRRIHRLLPQTAQTLVEKAPDLIDTLLPLTAFLERIQMDSLPGKPWRQRRNRAEHQYSDPDLNLQQNALLEQYARFLITISRQAPLLLLLDDLQWADPGSVALLFHLGRRLTDCPILIVGAYRPDEVALGLDEESYPLGRVVNELQRIYGEILIDLGQAKGQAFIDAWLDSEPNRLADFFRQTLFRQTGGHPLFTIELLRAMRERGDLQQDEDGFWQVQTEINWNRMPARVEGAIGERINRLPPSLQEILQVASIEGEEFTAEVVAEVLNLDERETVRLLSRDLDKVHVLVRAIGTRRTGARRLSRYRFRHILIQRYLYNRLDDVERSYQHEAVGVALEILHQDQITEVAAQLAWHFEIAQRVEKAAFYRQVAGDQARRSAALTEAIQHYQVAYSHWPDDDVDGRATLLRKLGECQWMTGQADDALETFEAAYKLFQSLENVEEAGAIQRLVGRVYWELGNRKKSWQHYQRALSILEPLSDSVELAWAISSISQMHMNAGEFDQAISWGEQALTLARRLEARGVTVHALNNVGASYIYTGKLAQGREMLEESVRLALAENLPHDAGRGRLNLGEVLTNRDYYEEARQIYALLYEQASQVHTILYAGSALIELARTDWLNGRWRDALARTPLIHEWLEEGQSMAYLHVIASTVFGHQYNDLGQPEAAYKTLKSSLSKTRSFDELQLMGPHLTQMARALAALGNEAELEKVARELLAAIVRAGYECRDSPIPLVLLTDVLPASLFAELFDEIVDVWHHLVQDNANAEVASRHAAVDETQGMIALFQENRSQAMDSFRQAVELWQAAARPYDQARTLKKLGQTWALAGEQAEALATFKQGVALIETLAAQLEDPEMRATFLQSPLAQAIQDGLAATKDGR